MVREPPRADHLVSGRSAHPVAREVVSVPQHEPHGEGHEAHSSTAAISMPKPHSLLVLATIRPHHISCSSKTSVYLLNSLSARWCQVTSMTRRNVRSHELSSFSAASASVDGDYTEKSASQVPRVDRAVHRGASSRKRRARGIRAAANVHHREGPN